MEGKEFGPVVIGKLLNIGGMLERKANQLLCKFDLNQQQYSILFEIQKAGKVNQKSMVNRLLLEKAHVSKIIKKLYGMGLITKTVAPGDKRSFWLSITPKGTDTVKQCRKVTAAWNEKWVGEIPQNQRTAVIDDLALLQKLFKDNIRND